MTRAEVLTGVLGEHFVMWHELDGGSPPGEWRCQCGQKFGFSDTAIDHVAAAVDAALGDLAVVVAAVETLISEWARPHDDHDCLSATGPKGCHACCADDLREVLGNSAEVLGKHDAEVLAPLRAFHERWGDVDADDLDQLTLWEELGDLLRARL